MSDLLPSQDQPPVDLPSSSAPAHAEPDRSQPRWMDRVQVILNMTSRDDTLAHAHRRSPPSRWRASRPSPGNPMQYPDVIEGNGIEDVACDDDGFRRPPR